MPVHVLAIGAHAADMEFTCGAALAVAVQEGGRASLLHLTLGEAGHPRLSRAAYSVQKKQEATEAARRLGADMRYFEYPDGLLPYNDEVAMRICDVIRQQKPDMIITHWGGSGHKDHQNTHYLVNDAVFYAALPSIERPSGPAHSVGQMFYAENWEDAMQYLPDTYLNVTAVVDTWRHAASAYELFRGGISSFRYADYYQALTITRGALSGFDHAIALRTSGGRTQRLTSLDGQGKR